MLTRDDVIRMARDVGASSPLSNFNHAEGDLLERFAAAAYAAGQAAERQRILSICKEVAADWGNFSGGADECIRRIEETK